MGTSAIGSADLALLRGNHQHIDNLALWITPLDTVQTGTITAVPSLSPYIQITWDGSTSNISVGQAVKIVSGSTLRAWAIIRKAPSGSTLYISTTPLGSPGTSTRIENTIQVGDTVTVYTHRPLWALFSRIAQRTFYKSFDIPYTDQGSQPPPVANTGEWQGAKVASGDSAAFTLPRLGSNTSFPFGSATISSTTWALPSGVTLQAGYALTDAVIEVDAVAGIYLVSLTVVDSNGKTHIAYCWLFVSDGTSGQSLSERYSVSIDSDEQTRKGRELQLTITGDSSIGDALYPGAGILLREWPLYDGSTLSEGVPLDSFVGYVSGQIDMSHDGDLWTASVTVKAPLLVAEAIPQPEQSLTEVTSPANWTQCTSVLSNPRGFLYYAMKWHTPALLDMHDFDAALTTPRRKFADFNTKTLASALNVAANFIVGNVGSASNGATRLRQHPLYFDNTDRNSLASIITWLAQDIRPPLQYTKRWGSENGQAITGAFAYNGSVTKAWLAMKRWHQGNGEAKLTDFTVTMSAGVTEVKAVVGHHLALVNADVQEISLELTRNQDVVDPADMLWCRQTTDSSLDPLGVGFTSERMVATRVSRLWERTDSGFVKRITLGLQPETFGQPGEEIKIGSARSVGNSGWSDASAVPYTPALDNAFTGNGLVLVVNDTGDLAVTYNILNSSPAWSAISDGLTGNINDIAWDYSSAFFANGNITTEALAVYVLTTDGTTLYVYRIPDILDMNGVPVELATATMNDSSVTTEARIECSETTPTLVLVAWKDQTGTEFIRSTDGGDTWSSKANIGSAVTDTLNDNAPLGMAIRGAVQLVSAPDATPEYGLYRATTADGAFSEVPNTVRRKSPLPLVKIADSSLAYATTPTSSTTPTVTFDAGGYSDYVLGSNDFGNNHAVAAVGNPDNAAQATTASQGSDIPSVSLFVTVTFPEAVTVNQVTVDGYADYTGSGDGWTVLVQDDTGTIKYAQAFAIGTKASWQNADTTGDPDFPLASQNSITVAVVHSGEGMTDLDFRIDNIVITLASAIVDAVDLQKITTYSGAATWLDVSPVAGEAPERPHDLVVDRIDDTILNAVTGFDTWYQSTDAAASWSSQESSSDKRAFITQGDGLIEGGDSEVKLSLDGGTTFDDKTGNLSAAFTIGTIKRVLIL